jgi:penicillin-binding protein 1A
VVEIVFSKDEILAMYLNTAYFGDGAYGIETAARHFFGPRARGVRSWSLNPYLFRDVAMRFMVPPELEHRDDSVVIGFTIDTEAQLYAEMAAADLLKRGRRSGYDSSAIIVMEPDGALVALATGHDYDGVDLVRNGRVSPGSTLKPFMALCALEQGMRPDDLVNDRRKEFRPGWVVQNFDGRFLGRISVETALARSRNPPAVELFDRFGAECFEHVLRRVGLKLDNPGTPTAVLGSQHVPLLALAAAYASFANGGTRVEPYAVRYARARHGEVIYRHRPARGERITSDRPYCDIMRMLRSVTAANGTGHNAAFAHPVWGKTGTSSRNRDALFAGFTAHYVAVVWLGRQARGDVRGRITGGEFPAELFRWLMSTLHEGRPVSEVACARQVAGAAPTSETR